MVRGICSHLYLILNSGVRACVRARAHGDILALCTGYNFLFFFNFSALRIARSMYVHMLTVCGQGRKHHKSWEQDTRIIDLGYRLLYCGRKLREKCPRVESSYAHQILTYLS